MKKELRVCMAGMGRTGREIASAILDAPDMELVMSVCGGHNPNIGKDIGALVGKGNGGRTGIILDTCKNLKESVVYKRPTVAIDFTTPEAVMENAPVFAAHNVNMVIGTTGFDEVRIKRLKDLAEKYHVGIVYAPNITLGVNVLMTLANLASTLLEEYDCNIVETHFKGKKDRPSGTALKIADQLQMGIAARANNSMAQEIPIHSLRAGGVIGRHGVMIAGEYDKVEIVHESFSRKAFAIGALRAARFVAGKSGYFEMRDVLNLDAALENYVSGGKPARRSKFA